MKDRHTKMMLYQQQGIPYYIIVDADKNKVEVYKLNEQNMYENITVNQQEAFEISFADCRFSIVFDAIWL
jgi:Uma2 family endonuclease